MGFFENRKIKQELIKSENLKKIAANEAKIAIIQARMSALEDLTNSGYSHGGASGNATWAKRWHASSYSPVSDIESNRKTLRERSRDLAMNSSIAAAAVNATRTNVVGPGLTPKPKIDYEFLGISKDEAAKLTSRIKKEFKLWAESTLCDAADLNNFYELQQIAFRDWLVNGEEFCLIKYAKAPEINNPYQLRIKLIESDRVCNDGSSGTFSGTIKRLQNGNSLMNGIEINSEGKVVAYHICSVNPQESGSGKKEWTRVVKRSEKSGNPNVLHIFNAERAEQYRGVPLLAPVVQSIKQISRYTEAEIMAAIVNSMFTIFVTTENGDDIAGFGGVDEEEPAELREASQAADEEVDQIALGTGTVNYLKQGEDIKPVESTHPNNGYDVFVKSIITQIGAALEISPEVLLKQFQASFSASKGAINETWKAFRMRRSWFVNAFCQEVYNLWFAEAVSKGRINAPGFFIDPLIRNAYTACTWNGPTPGHLNPVQEVNAAVTRVENGFSTREDEAASMNGSDFEDNVRALESENAKIAMVNDVFNKQEETK